MSFREGPPWNKGMVVGQMRPFTRTQIQSITRLLEEQKSFRDLCLFCLGIDTMLRSSDLIEVKVADVIAPDGDIKSEFRWSQKKTGRPVTSALTPYTKSSINVLIKSKNLSFNDYLFPSRKLPGEPITTGTIRRLVKKWAYMLGLPEEEYSGHSLRRTKPSLLYAKGVRPEMLRILLGHQSLQSTQSYLGIDQNEALEIARQHDCFREEW